MDKEKLLSSVAFVLPSGVGLYDKIRVRLKYPPNVSLVGLLTPDSDGIGLNRKVSIPRSNIRKVEKIAHSSDRL